MTEICSLDFLNKEKFDLDIISEGGTKLFSAETEITPEALLSLYFKKFTTKNPLKTPEEIEAARKKALQENPPKNLEEYLSFFEEFININPENLNFDKDNAEKIMKLSCSIGALVDMPQVAMEKLKLAAYFYKIGVIKLTETDLSIPGFSKKVGETGYNLLTLKMRIMEEVAVTANDYMLPYDVSSLNIQSKDTSDIPYSHIVSIADYYYKLIDEKNFTKEDALKKMLKFGGNKFNIFLLHKFIKMMRESDE